MAKTYKSDFEVFNGTDYDKHCFSTTADQVEMSAIWGKNVKLSNCLSYFLLHCVDIRRGTTSGSSSAGTSVLPYRDGFTRLNTCVLSAMAYSDDGSLQLNGSPSVSVSLGSNGITVKTTPGIVDFIVVLFRTDQTVPDGEFIIG